MFTNVTTLAARLCESRRSGTAASRLWAAAGVSSDLAGGVKAPCPISKLPENEADTVRYVPPTVRTRIAVWGTVETSICIALYFACMPSRHSLLLAASRVSRGLDSATPNPRPTAAFPRAASSCQKGRV